MMTNGSFQSIDFEPVDCMICGSPQALPAGQVSSHGARFDYVICTGCGLKYMRPRPTVDWYQAHYAGEFWEYKKANRSWRDADRKWRLRDMARWAERGRKRHQAGRLARLIPLMDAYGVPPVGGVILDIGCAFGVIGAALGAHFQCKVYGVEPNATARDVAVEENGLEILAETAEGLIAAAAEQPQQFDFILMSNVLENIVAPKPILAACHTLLKPGGAICIHMPNFYFYDAMNPYHPYIYSPQTLRLLAEQAGLEVYAEDHRSPIVGSGVELAPYRKADLFMTLFARPAVSALVEGASCDADQILADQATSLERHQQLRARRKGLRGYFRRSVP